MNVHRLFTRKQIAVILLCTLLLMTLIRLVWIHTIKPAEADITDGQFMIHTMEDELLLLQGDWAFYPNQFIDPKKGDGDFAYSQTQDHSLQRASKVEYGSFRLQLYLPTEQKAMYGIRFQEIRNAATVYVNGEQVATKGIVGHTKDSYTGEIGPLTALFEVDSDVIDIVVHSADFDTTQTTMLTAPIFFGTADKIMAKNTGLQATQWIVIAILLLHAVYAFSLFIVNGQRKGAVSFSIVTFVSAMAILFDDERLLSSFFQMDAIWTYKLSRFFYIYTLWSLVLFVQTIFSEVKGKLTYFFLFVLAFEGIVVIITPFNYLSTFYYFTLLSNLSIYIILFLYTVQVVRRGNGRAIYISIGLLAILTNIGWGIVKTMFWPALTFYPFDFIFATLAFVYYLFAHYVKVSQENKQRAEELEMIDKRRNEFLANTSHELRNPLHGMINIAQTMLDNNTQLAKDEQTNLALLIDIGKRMNYTLNDLTEISLLKEGKVKLDKQSLSLYATTAFVLDILQFSIEGKDIRLDLNIRPDFPNVIADENRLIQILINIIHNAIKYTEAGTITIEATHDENMATVYVKDTGIGIDSDDLQMVFQPYKRLSDSQAGLTTGIGIGLSVTKQLVELGGGDITYHSHEQGTTFLFTLPLATNVKNEHASVIERVDTFSEIAAEIKTENLVSTTPVAHELTPDLRADEEKATILIVDDDSANVRVLQQMLQSDYYTFVALSGKDALQLIDEHAFDLIIIDVMMPAMSGYELTKIVRKKYTNIDLPIMLITARNIPEDIEIAFRSGANDYLVKPVNARELKTRVRALTALKKSIRETLRIEAAWLQAQIQPHFLYNTLNSIASLAQIDHDRMIDLLDAFGKYLQRSYAIQNVETEIPLSDELELVRAYVHIETERFGDKINVIYDIDSHVLIQLPPLTIQPLVENAIMHGILPKQTRCTLTVRIKDMVNHVKIEVIDDGVGMSQTKIQELLTVEPHANDGVGVKNTNRRLIQLYGNGLNIKSSLHEGTTVSFFIPKTLK